MGFWEQMIENPYGANPGWEWDGAEFRPTTWQTTVATAEVMAFNLRARGVGAGTVVPAVLTNGPEVTSAILGIWLAGATVASLPIIARGMTIPSYMTQLTRLCQALGAEWLLAEERFLQLMPPELRLGVDVLTYETLLSGHTGLAEPPALEERIFIQFSSGTTAEPRGVELSGLAIEAQLEMLARHLQLDPERDLGYMWLPQSHDMNRHAAGSMTARASVPRSLRGLPPRSPWRHARSRCAPQASHFPRCDCAWSARKRSHGAFSPKRPTPSRIAAWDSTRSPRHTGSLRPRSR